MARMKRLQVAPEEGVVAGLNHDGAAVLREGKTAFVPGALPGERIRFRRTIGHRQYDEGELLEVIEPSTDRVTPRCAHFGVCGGCALQHLAPGAQILMKQRELADNLERIAKTAPAAWLEPMTGPVWNYRRRARLGVKYVPKKGRVLVGFRERMKPYVAELAGCDVLVGTVSALITPLARMIDGLAIRSQLPQIEVAAADRELALVMRVLENPGEADRARLREFEIAHGCRILLQSGGLDSIVPLDGTAPSLSYALPDFGLELAFLPTDFIQINAAINRQLILRAIELLGTDSQSRVLDLFCGLGNFTLPLARRVADVVGVEGEAGLVARARDNAVRNGITNASFHVANLAAEGLDEFPWARGPFSHVLLDPPRAGALEVLPLLRRIAPRRIVYISCHPGSLARDIGELVHVHGFRLMAAGVLDMFPHTNHVESIAVLEPTP